MILFQPGLGERILIWEEEEMAKAQNNGVKGDSKASKGPVSSKSSRKVKGKVMRSSWCNHN
jgi:hypothetical protein